MDARQPCDPASLAVAKQIGLDGVQVDMGTVANDMHLRRPEVQKAYLEASKRTGVAIASLAEAAFWTPRYAAIPERPVGLPIASTSAKPSV